MALVTTALDALWLSADLTPKCVRGGDGSWNYPSPLSFHLYNPLDDVSGYGGFACDGCHHAQHPRDWNITRLEMLDEPDPKSIASLTTSRVGFITAYQQRDGTYELVSTLKVGQPFIHQGTCVRAPRDSQPFDCRDIFGSSGGHHILTCVSSPS